MKLNKFAYLYSKPLGNHTLKIMKKIPGNLLLKTWKNHGNIMEFCQSEKVGTLKISCTELCKAVHNAQKQRLVQISIGFCTYFISIQGSHSDWKNGKAFSSQGILNRLEKSGKITQTTGKLREFQINII